MVMKNLLIPFLPELDTLSLEEARNVMEEKAARRAVDTCNWPETYAYTPVVMFDIAYSKEAIYIHYFVHGLSLRALAVNDNEYVYEDSCVEFFIRPENDLRYYNLEFNCIGTAYAAYGEGRHGRTHVPVSELAKIRRLTTLPAHEPIQEQKGCYSWEILLSIPFEVIGMDKNNLPESFRANVYKCADGTCHPHYLTWNEVHAPQPDYHRPEDFGRMTFSPRKN